MPIDGDVVDGLYSKAYIRCVFSDDLIEIQRNLFYNGNGTVVKEINRPSFSKFYTSFLYETVYNYILNTSTGVNIKKITNGHEFLLGGSTYFDKNGKKWWRGAYMASIHYDTENYINFTSCDNGYSPDNSKIDTVRKITFSYQPQNNTIARTDLKALRGIYEPIVPDSIMENIVYWVGYYCKHTDSNWLERKKNGFIRDVRHPAPSQSSTASDSTSYQLPPLLPYHKSSQT